MNAPNHLSTESKQYWRRLNSEFDLTPDACILLKCALENYDQAQAARELILRDGLVVDGKRHPAFDVQKQSYGLFQRFMRQLELDIDPPKANGRPLSSVA